jgi:hypothetical protein
MPGENPMICDVCGNDYDKAFQVISGDRTLAIACSRRMKVELDERSESERCHAEADALIARSLFAMLREERLAYSDLAESWRSRAEKAEQRQRHQPPLRQAAFGPG